MLDELQKDALAELVNIGVGRGATVLNEMLGTPVELKVPYIEVVQPEEAMSRFGEGRLAAVQLPFEGAFKGAAEILFPAESANRLVAALTGEPEGSGELDAMRAGTLTEVGNIVLNSVIGTLGNLLDGRVEYFLPEYVEGDAASLRPPDLAEEGEAAVALLCKARFAVNELMIRGDLLIVFRLASFERIKRSVDRLTGAKRWPDRTWTT